MQIPMAAFLGDGDCQRVVLTTAPRNGRSGGLRTKLTDDAASLPLLSESVHFRVVLTPLSPPVRMTSRIRPLWLVAAVAILGLGWGGFRHWQLQRQHEQQQLSQQVESALEELRRGPASVDLRPLLDRLEQDRTWREDHRLLAGAERLRRGEADRALLFLTSIEPKGNRLLPHQLFLGEALYQVGRIPEADVLFARLVRDFPNDADVQRWVATILYDRGQVNPAMAALERAAELDPTAFLPHRLMALTYVQEFRQYDDAIRHYRLALERNPPAEMREEMLRELAQCLVFQKEFGEALDVIQQVSPSPRQQLVQIEALRGLGETEQAVTVWNQLQTASPDLEGVQLLGALLDLDQGEAQAARDRLRKTLARDPHNLVARNQMIRACQLLGETEQAKAEAERLQQSKELHERHDRLATQALAEPANAEVRLELAEISGQLGRPADAVRWRRSAGQPPR